MKKFKVFYLDKQNNECEDTVEAYTFDSRSNRMGGRNPNTVTFYDKNNIAVALFDCVGKVIKVEE